MMTYLATNLKKVMGKYRIETNKNDFLDELICLRSKDLLFDVDVQT